MSPLFLSRWCHCGLPKSSGFHFFEVCATKPLFLLYDYGERKLLSRVWLCNPKDCSPLGFLVHGLLRARILERMAIPFSRRSSWPRDQTWVSCSAGSFNNVCWYYSPCLDFIIFCFLRTLLLLSFLPFTFYYLYLTNIWTCFKPPSWRKSTFLNLTFPLTFTEKILEFSISILSASSFLNSWTYRSLVSSLSFCGDNSHWNKNFKMTFL